MLFILKRIRKFKNDFYFPLQSILLCLSFSIKSSQKHICVLPWKNHVDNYGILHSSSER
jgi:hypothetical protein